MGWAGALAPKWLWRWILLGGFVLILLANLPGHLSVDSVIALGEGRTGLRISWGPAMYSRILGLFDAVVPGGGLYVVASLLVLFAAWWAMARLRPRVSWAAPVLLALFVATPEIFIYQAIVWKDVLFANLAVAAFVALGLAVVRWEAPRVRWTALAVAWFSLAIGCLVRQNGAIAILMSAPVLAWSLWPRGWRPALGWAAAALAVPLLLAAGFNQLTPLTVPPGAKTFHNKGVRLVEHYDLVGALADNPNRPLRYLQADNPDYLAIVRREAPHVYSPVRSDMISGSSAYGHALWHFSDAAMQAEWRAMIASDPVGYARRRLAVFEWTFLTPKLDLCLPVHLGVSGPPQLVAQLHLPDGMNAEDQRLFAYAQPWFHTPFYSHLFYAVLAAAAAGFLLLRRQGADLVMAGLMVAALGFAASFALISLACDYRYLYFLDLAAITGVLYVALDPRLRGAGSAPSSAARTSA